MLAIVLLAAAVAQPGQLKTFGDWTVGCDNGRACQAVALLGPGLEGGSLMLRRGAEANAPVAADFALNDLEPVSADLGGRTLRLGSGGEPGQVWAADVPALLAALRTASSAALRGADGKDYSVSLKGASAAMIHMDDVQKRVGTVTALVRPGPIEAREVPAPPQLPIVVRPAPSARAAPRLDRAALLKRHADLGCDATAGPADVSVDRLDAGSTLVLVPDRCGSGAYNHFATALIADNGGRTRIARFESDPGMGEAIGAIVVNANWDAKMRLFETYAKGRGIGDCGVRQDFAWDGRMFRLARRSEMGECRGSIDYITTWRAVVR